MRLTDVQLPPRHTITVDYNPDDDLMNAGVTVFREGTAIGTASFAVTKNGEYSGHDQELLQRAVDGITKRGVRAS